jgi:hypothetical protein
LNDDRVIDSAFCCTAKEAIAVKEHVPEELGVGRQPGCINLETLALNLENI